MSDALLPDARLDAAAPAVGVGAGVDQASADRAARLGLVLLVVLNVVDVVLTKRFLALGGVEGNPLMAAAVQGWEAAAVKAAIILALVARFAARPATTARLALTWAGVGVYAITAYVNWSAIQALGG